MRETVERDGVRYVLVPEGEYDRLLEARDDLEDMRLYDEAKAAPSEFIPLAMTERMLAGESPVRAWREHRGMTQEALAGAAGISKPFLSQIESGARTPSVDTARRLADALGVEVGDLV